MAFHSHVTTAGVKADDLRFLVNYRLEAVDVNNKRFFVDKELEVIPGDFLKDRIEVYTHEKTEPFKQQ